jgi:pimeloyl-ACP methyl ester carboxylesterase
MYDSGSGPPLIVVPGIQGRWEWLRPALDALQTRCRTISYSLCGDFGAGWRRDRTLGFENYLAQLDAIYDRAGVQRGALCGSSYGGFIALRYAATRPERVSHLILASSPSPGWRPNPRQSGYIASPWISTPAFLATAPARLWPEIESAFDDLPSRLRFCTVHMMRVLSAPAIPPLMAARIVEQQSMDFLPDCARVKAPTLVVTGEQPLDSVVPVDATRRYLSLIPDAKYGMIERTGHLGLLTRPDRFASVVTEFVLHADSHRSAWASRPSRSAAR